ncbi:hypothetical protein BDR22DRAFT_967979 [Usnea florida]
MLSTLRHAFLYSSFPLVAASPPFRAKNDHECWFIDGSLDLAGGPCYHGVGASMCCYTGENCLPNGLCIATPNGPVGPYDNSSSIWRRSCTDITWQDLACLAIAYEIDTESQQLSACSDETFCPRTNKEVNTTCCDNQLGNMPEYISPSVLSSIRATVNSTISSASPTALSKASTPSASGSRTTTSTSTTTPALTTPPQSSTAAAGGLDQSTKIGTGVGLSLGTIVLASLSFVAFRLYKKSKSRPKNIARAEEERLGSKNLEENTGIQVRHEMVDAASPNELHTPYNTHEIEAESRL